MKKIDVYLYLTMFVMIVLVSQLIVIETTDSDDIRQDYIRRYEFCEAFVGEQQRYDCQDDEFRQIFPNREQFERWMENEILEVIERAIISSWIIHKGLSLIIGALFGFFFVYIQVNLFEIIRDEIIQPLRKNSRLKKLAVEDEKDWKKKELKFLTGKISTLFDLVVRTNNNYIQSLDTIFKMLEDMDRPKGFIRGDINQVSISLSQEIRDLRKELLNFISVKE